MLQSFKDAATVAADLADVAAQFTDVPPQLVQLGSDAIGAVMRRDPVALAKLITEADAVFEHIEADGVNAEGAIAQLETDLRKFLADISSTGPV